MTPSRPIFAAEQSLQRAVADYLTWCVPAPPSGPWWTAVNPIPAKSRAAAGISRAMGLKAGTPDIVLCWKGGLVGIEFKAEHDRGAPRYDRRGEQQGDDGSLLLV